MRTPRSWPWVCSALALVIAAPVDAQPADAFSRTPAGRTSTPSRTNIEAGRADTPASPPRATTPLPSNFNTLGPRSTITAGGKAIAAGDIAKAIGDELARLTPRGRNVEVSRRVPASAQMSPQSRASAIGKNATSPMSHSALVTGASQTRKTDDLRKLTCAHRGPPEITDVAAPLVAGGRSTLNGYCFGMNVGRVEVAGQFKGGPLRLSFASWNMTYIELVVPADIRGVTDQPVTVVVVTGEGKRSAPIAAQFVAARERVPVPANLWNPGATLDMMSVEDVPGSQNQVYAGVVSKSVRVQRECRVTDMETAVIAGIVERIEGFDLGPPNEARVNIAWRGACTGSTIRTYYDSFLVSRGADVSFKSACRIGFEARATADCPAGVAP